MNRTSPLVGMPLLSFTKSVASFATIALGSLLIACLDIGTAYASCGGTVRVWNGSVNNRWDNASNWTDADFPNSTSEDALVQAATRNCSMQENTSIGCFEIQSGQAVCRDNRTLTITGDYFRNLNTNSLRNCDIRSQTFVMGGTTDQTFENVDAIPNLTISNNATVTITNAFEIHDALTISGTTTTLRIQADLNLSDSALTFTIPAGTTVEVEQGATLTAAGGITVNGTLRIESGSTLVIGNGQTLQVNSGATLELTGTSGNVAQLKAPSAGNTFTANIAGSLNASYFRVDRPDTAGLNVTGTITSLENGEFHYLAANGYALTLGAAATIPSTMDGVGFFNDDGASNVRNIDASSFNPGGNPSTTLNDWNGGAGGAANENDSNNEIDWGTQAGAKLTLSDNTGSGSPPTTVTAGTADVYFATFAFAMTEAISPATDIEDLTITMTGTAEATDLDNVKLYKDDGAGTNCVYDAGTDTQIGSDLTLSGTPPTASITGITSGDIQTSGTTPACVHVVTSVSSNAADADTIQFSISATSDVTNSEGYDFSDASGPPVSAGTSTIDGADVSNWRGKNTTNWNTGGNWQGTVPNAARDCQVGAGINITELNIATGSCLNADLVSGGTLSFLSTTNELAVYGNLDVDSGYTFTDASSGVIAMRGAASQSLKIETTFPGDVTIANTGTSPSNVVTVSADSTIAGDLTISSGELKIEDTYTLTVQGNITVASGATLYIAPGGSLALGNGSTVTIDSGGTLNMLGSSSKTAVMTSELSTTSYSVTVNGTIAASYYQFDNLGTNGVTIASSATIDATYHLQDGSWTYPVNSSGDPTMLTLNTAIPGGSMDNQFFALDGSSVTNVTNIDTTGASAGPPHLTIDNFSGDLSGSAFDVDPSYNISWTGAVTTIDVTQEDTGPSSIDAGSTYTMGRFGFQQTDAGADYSDTDLTSITLTLTGTGNAGDIDLVTAYYDSDCDSSGGTPIGSGTFSGSPAKLTLNTAADIAIIDASSSSPPLRCVYVTFAIASNATNGNTVGVEINASTDTVNDLGYAINPSITFPLDLGTAASINNGGTNTWNGNTSTDWFIGSNWSSGSAPDASTNCDIYTTSNNPVIGSGTAVCKKLHILSGSLTMTNGVGASLEIYGDFDNDGTFTQNDGTLTFRDSGSATTQTISSVSTISAVTFNKTSGGSVEVGGTSLTINTLTIPSGSNFDFTVPNGQTLTLPNGVTLNYGTLDVEQGGTLEIGASQSITVGGGTFRTSGINDSYPQTESTKATVTVSGSGRWSFVANSGTVDLTGFHMESLDVSGLQILGTTTLSNLNGGQFTNLDTDFSTPVRAIQLNTTGAVPTTATNIGFHWDGWNSHWNDPCTNCPSTSDSYYLVYAPQCSSNTISFEQWFGDWSVGINDPTPSDKVFTSACTVNIAASASPVSLLSYQAKGHRDAITLEWETSTEVNHAGFNVYRSRYPDKGFLQVNPRLIRNFKTTSTMKGRYRYTDRSVNHDMTYYYYLEDISYSGAKTWHGPRSARALTSLPPAPPPSTDEVNEENSGSAPPDTTPSTDPDAVAAPGQTDLGNGVFISLQTSHRLHLTIEPPAASWSVSPWQADHQSMSVPGYASTTTAGWPELVSRTILLEVDPSRTSVTAATKALVEDPEQTVAIGPAPTWQRAHTGTLAPIYQPDQAAYSKTSYEPASFYRVTEELKSIGNQKFIEVEVFPYLYRASDRNLRRLKKLSLHFTLDGDAEVDPASPPATSISAAAGEGNLRIGFEETGMYQLNFSDLIETGVSDLFEGTPIDNLRLYSGHEEVPIEIISTDTILNAGDAIIFYGIHIPTLESRMSEVVLSQHNFYNRAAAPLRMGTLNGQISDNSESPNETYRRAVAEVNSTNAVILDRPIGGHVERFYWQRIFAQAGQDPDNSPAYTTLEIPIQLDGLIRDARNNVFLSLKAAARGVFTKNPTHHLGVWLNSNPYQQADAIIATQKPSTIFFNIPADQFVEGLNIVKIRVLGDTVPPGEWSMVDIDRLQVDYRGVRDAIDDQSHVFHTSDDPLAVYGFTNNDIVGYDVSVPLDVRRITGASIRTDAGEHSFHARIDTGPDGEHGSQYMVLSAAQRKVVASLEASHGTDRYLQDSDQQADLIVIGPAALISAAANLIEHRRSDGLTVTTASLAQIYAEFSGGRPSSAAIRSFLTYVRSAWQTPKPRYLLFLGDATYDPRNILEHSDVAQLMPIRMEQGVYEDFGNDNWFGSADDQLLPHLAIGRIPANTQTEIMHITQKIIDYESGALAPKSGLKDFYYLIDKDTMGEEFAKNASQLAASTKSARPDFITFGVDRQAHDDQVFKAAIDAAFHSGPFMLTYLGHGAENMWAGAGIFNNASAMELTNTALPIVVGLNCLNARFFRPNPADKTLGEQLIFNPNGGAVAFIGSTTMTLPPAQVALATAMSNIIGQVTKENAREVRLGDLLQRAKHAIPATKGNADTIKSYTLFGDPAMRLPAALFLERSTQAPQTTQATEQPSTPLHDPTTEIADNSDKKSSLLGLQCSRIQATGSTQGWVDLITLLTLLGLPLMWSRLRSVAGRAERL